MSKIKKVILILAGLILFFGVFAYIGYENYSRDKEYCELMESKDEFTEDEIQWLYHWMNPDKYDDHCPSERFQKLYNEKIRPL